MKEMEIQCLNKGRGHTRVGSWQLGIHLKVLSNREPGRGPDMIEPAVMRELGKHLKDDQGVESYSYDNRTLFTL